MGSRTDRDNAGRRTEDYWRRRAAALAGVMAVVAVLSWACSGDGEERAAQGQKSAGAAPSSLRIPPAVPTVTVTATPKATRRPAVDRDACAPGSMAVTMRATDEVYRAGDRPRFMVTAVNIGDRACTLDSGARGLDLVITSGGDRIWSSAACADQGHRSPAKLRRGVPLVRTITWDRKRGCGGARAPARPGTYVATLKSRTIKPKTAKQIFALR